MSRWNNPVILTTEPTKPKRDIQGPMMKNPKPRANEIIPLRIGGCGTLTRFQMA